MARREPPAHPHSLNPQLPPASKLAAGQPVDFDIQQELDQLEEMILDSAHIPLTRLSLVDEEKLLSQLDLVRINLPEAFEQAMGVIQRKQDILAEAEDYARRLVQSAQQRAAEILDETGIIQQAEIQASQIRQQVQQECEALQGQTLAEIEQSRRAVTQELQHLRQQTLAECQEIQQGADSYADSLLTNLEHQLAEMLRVVRNGRHQLYGNSSTDSAPSKKLPESSRKRH